jgi:uncharacterized protein (TIGR03790 family)
MLIRLLIPFLVLMSAACGAPPTNRRVLIVYDSTNASSRELALYYGRQRRMPTANLCPVAIPKDIDKAIPIADYPKLIRDPIRACLNRVGRDQILYIVFAYVRPFLVGVKNAKGAYALDSYVSDIWDLYGTRDFDPIPPAFHPYYVDNHARDNVWLPFASFADMRAKPEAPLLYAVWRLDGATPQIARGLVDKALKAEAAHGPSGQACIDERADPLTLPDAGYPAGDWDLYRAAEFLTKAGFHVMEDNSETEFGTPPSGTCSNAALYSGWYKLNNYNDAFTWNEGAIGFHLDSLSAEDPRKGKNWSANALMKGITVTSGAVDEPYLAGLPRPSGVFRDLLAGSNVGDAFLRNTRFLKWMIINIGDPLYTPFPGGKRARP